MQNPLGPSGSIRADKVGAFGVFRVLFGRDCQIRSLCLSSEERCLARATLLSPVPI